MSDRINNFFEGKWKHYKKLKYKYYYGMNYLLTDYNEQLYMLHIDNQLNHHQNGFIWRFLNNIKTINVETPRLLQYGYFNNKINVYIIFSWVQGQHLSSIISNYSFSTRYHIGYIMGKNLKAIHETPVDEKDFVSFEEINSNKWRKVSAYLNSDFKFPIHNDIVKFITDNFDEIKEFQPAYIHNNFYDENIVLYQRNKLGLINFTKSRVDDPIYDLVKMQIYTNDKSYNFALGVLDGYFDKNIPEEFWKKYAVLTAYSCISMFYALSIKEQNSDLYIKNLFADICYQYDNFHSFIPKWYKKDRITTKEKEFSFNKDFILNDLT